MVGADDVAKSPLQILLVARATSTADFYALGGFADLVQVSLGQFDVGRSEVLVQAVQLAGARDRHNPRLLGQQPGDGDLGSGGILACRDAVEQAD